MKKEYILAGILVILAGILLGCGVFYTQEYLESKNNQYQEPTEDKQSNNNETQNDKTEKNDITQYIKDKDYQIVDKNSSLVKDLYNKVTYNYSMLDNYIQEKITNDTIITLTLQLMEKENMYDEENCEKFDGMNNEEVCFKHVFNNDKIDDYAKKLFGPDVAYDITKYSGAGNGCESYENETNRLVYNIKSGCGTDEMIISDIETVYQTNNKLVIIEKSLYYVEYGTDIYQESIAHYPIKYNYQFSRGIYNNIRDGKKLSFDTNLAINDCLEKYENDVTYYAYTFTKAKDGNYYYTDFSRLN